MTAPVQTDGTLYRCYLVEGSDAGLVSQALTTLIGELATVDADSIAAVEEYGNAGDDNSFVGPALDACRTPPFFAPQRIVIIREVSALDAAQVSEVVEYLKDPSDTSVLILVHVGRTTPAALSKVVKATGTVINAVPAPTSRARSQWFADHLANSPVRLDHNAAALLQEHLGEDLSRVEGILSTLEMAFGPGATVHADELEPFLGSAGSVAPWDLTDALDNGKSPDAIAALDRMTGGGERHPLQVLAVLNRHYGAMLRLDGSDITDEAGASKATGLAPYPAKKVMTQARRLGHERIVRAISLLADADLDLRGRVGWPPELVLEVLVARLAQMGRAATRNASSRGQRSRVASPQ